MKRLIILIFIITSFSCIAQNRFEKVFEKADSAFTQKIDSLKFNQVIKEIETDTFKITMTTEECLLLYFNGYIEGSFSFKTKKKL